MDLVTRTIRGADASRVLLLMHGLGADEHDLIGLVEHLDPDGRCLTILPRGPYPARPDTAHGAWFAFVPAERTIPTLESCLNALETLIDRTCREHGFDPRDTILGGFSQGGITALAYALHAAPAAAFSWSGVPELSWVTIRDVPTRMLVQHGRSDDDTPLADAEAFARSVGATFIAYDSGHTVTEEMVYDAARFIDDPR